MFKAWVPYQCGWMSLSHQFIFVVIVVQFEEIKKFLQVCYLEAGIWSGIDMKSYIFPSCEIYSHRYRIKLFLLIGYISKKVGQR